MRNYFETKTKQDCCGCAACCQICPKNCITLDEDNEGFSYPHVGEECINCKLCYKVCPVINQRESITPDIAYAAYNLNDGIRQKSSSGGIFTLLAEKMIDENGVVYGASFDKNWEVIHDFVEAKENLENFRGSKYVQSKIANSYKQIKSFLDSNRKVLFSGTPCQVSALNFFLKKDYQNLITVDFICHGVPSPKVWRKYKKELLANYSGNTLESPHFEKISFRGKNVGWRRFSFTADINIGNQRKIHQETFDENIYTRGFLADIYLRPSCYDCLSKSLKSGSDITIADFWGVEKVLPDWTDDKGASLVFLNSNKAKTYCSNLRMYSKEVICQEVIKYNPAFGISSKVHRNRSSFFNELDHCQCVSELIKRNIRPTFSEKLKYYIFRGVNCLRRVLHKYFN